MHFIHIGHVLMISRTRRGTEVWLKSCREESRRWMTMDRRPPQSKLAISPWIPPTPSDGPGRGSLPPLKSIKGISGCHFVLTRLAHVYKQNQISSKIKT